MQTETFKVRLARYMDAGFPLIYINTFEEKKADSIIKEICKGREVYEWSEIKGFTDFSTGTEIDASIETLETALAHAKALSIPDNSVLVLKDIHSRLEDPKIAAILKGIAQMITDGAESTVIIVSNILVIPKELEKYITILEIDYMSDIEIKGIIRNFIAEQELEAVDDNLIEEFAVSFKGLSEFEIKNLLALSVATDGELNRKDLQNIFDSKQQTIKKSGLLEMIPLKESLNDIGGLDNLKDWLRRKAKVYKNINKAYDFGVDMPKGVLIAGIPGCGKSLSAKAAAKLFDVPLLRLDMSRIMGKYVGESESNLRKAIALAEAISPCVLWVDELEKAFAGIGGAGGSAEVTTRLFGNFLTWLQEKTSSVFVVATANNITGLPPELLRKGRFDEIFYVGLPNRSERENIFKIHMSKRRPNDLKNIDLNDLASRTGGYSGADIEGVVIDAVESAFADNKSCVSTEDVKNVISQTHSLSEIMGDSLEKMKKEFSERKLRNASR